MLLVIGAAAGRTGVLRLELPGAGRPSVREKDAGAIAARSLMMEWDLTVRLMMPPGKMIGGALPRSTN